MRRPLQLTKFTLKVKDTQMTERVLNAELEDNEPKSLLEPVQQPAEVFDLETRQEGLNIVVKVEILEASKEDIISELSSEPRNVELYST